MKSETVMLQGASVVCAPFDVASKLPRGPIRFVGVCVALPLAPVFACLSIPWLIVGLALSIWEAANR